jgi:hypothetical protein
MADKKISALTAATTPLAGTEVLPIVQGGSTTKVSVANLTAGRTVTGTAFSATAGNYSVATNYGLSFGVGSTYIYGSAASAYIRLDTNNVTRFEVNASGNAVVSTGNLVIGTAAKGIDFSANGGDVLSQYDEGSWTVRLFDSAGGGNQSATTVTGYYTRVGNLVQCSFWGLNNISTAGMTAGNGLFIELPFTASATGSGTGSFASENITFNGRANATPAVPVSNNRAILRAYGTGTSTATVLVSNVGAGANIDYFSMTYRV